MTDTVDGCDELKFACPDCAPASVCSCGGRRWVNDKNWCGETRRPGAGRIPCGFCNHGGWDVPDIDPAPTGPNGGEAGR